MPKLSDFGFLSGVKVQALGVNVAVISGSIKKNEIERAIALGAQGYILKDSQSEEFIKAVQKLLAGQRFLPIEWVGKVDWKLTSDQSVNNTSSTLTERQRQVLELMRDGLQNKQIAVVLGIKP